MDDADKMQDKNFADIVNISRVLPSLTPLELQTEFLEFKNDPDRVTKILKKHFKFYNEERENQMGQDIKKIMRVLPDMTINKISEDLANFGPKKNRVQLVLKKYFATLDVSPVSCKRSLDNIDALSNKTLKIDETASVSNTKNVVASECTSDHLLPPNSPINKLDLDSNNYNINELLLNTSKSIIENNNEINSDEQNVEETVSSTIEPSKIVEAKNVNLEMTNLDSSLFSNESLANESLANEIVSSISNILTESNEEVPLASPEKSCDEKQSLFEIINSFYPDLTIEEIELMLSHLDINIYESVDDATVNVALNEIMNYLENKDTSQRVETNNDNTNKLVKTDSQSTESSSTEEYDFIDDLSEYFQIPNDVINSTSVFVKQETPYQVDLPNYTDKNLGLLNKICREIEDDSNDILKNKVFIGHSDSNSEKKSFTGIASGTDNWVKSALVQKDKTIINPNITASTSELNIIKPAKILTEGPRKRSVCSTVTSASINTEPRANRNPFVKALDVSLTPQIKQENVMNYLDYGLESPRSAQDDLSPPKRSRKSENWAIATSCQMVEKSFRNIERPTRDNLKSSLSNNFGGAGHSRATAYTNAATEYNKNFVQYLQNRNNISNEYNADLKIDGNVLNFENPFIPNQYLANNNNNLNPNNNNNNLDMSRRSTAFLTKKEEKVVKALFCELGNSSGNGNTCNSKKCIKNAMALKVRKDLFRRSSKTPDSIDADDDNKSKSPTIPIIDISESSSSNSNPLPGTSTTLQPNENHPFFYKIMEMFPDICPDYLRAFCMGKDQSSATLDYLISTLLEVNYDRREQHASPAPAPEFDDQYKTLLDLFPDADPTYLQHHCERLFEHPNEFKEFVASLLEHKNYPSKEEYLKKMKLSAQQKQYTTKFDVNKFLEVIPNPEEFFKNRNVKRNLIDEDYALTFLKNHYCHLTIKDINTIFRECNNSVVRASVVLDKMPKSMKTKRRLYPLTNCLNIPLLQEIAYVKNRSVILNYMKMQEQKKIANRQFAKNAGLLKTCECCFDDEVMPEEMACCENNHVFCKECVKKGCEVKIGEGKLDFPCLTTCEAKFSLQVLQSVLTPKVFSKMAQKKQLEEVKSAGIEDLEFCPFCDFATIPAPGDKLFRCLNNDCMKESCRECKEPSHIPLRCDEVEKENDVKLRTYIEDKMTEALVRKCYKCGMKFIKEEGCNKMTCSCGAMMCYVCNQPVKDYKHFNGQGGDQFHLCPLYSDTHKLHMDAVKLSAENAKKELGIANNQLKIDPTANLDQHYKRLANRNPQNLPPGMEQLNPQPHIHIQIQEFHLARR